MKKIIFIDDGISESTNEYRIKDLESRSGPYASRISIEFFSEVLEPEKLNSLLENNDLVFLHKSYGDRRYNSVLLAKLRENHPEKIIIFSGGSETDLEKLQFRRQKVYENFYLFVDYLLEDGERKFEILQYGNKYSLEEAKSCQRNLIGWLKKNLKDRNLRKNLLTHPLLRKLFEIAKLSPDEQKEFERKVENLSSAALIQPMIIDIVNKASEKY